jgi:CRP/FNR family cyclic AMP-dependent transcriptional regulator
MEQTRLQWLRTDQVAGLPHEGHDTRMQTNSMERLTLLRSLPLFEGLDDKTLSRLADDSRQRRFRAGEIICYQGDPGATCHIILRGRVRIFLAGEDGRELSVRIMRPGEIFGEMALLEGLPRSANVEALEETQTLELHHDVLLDCLRESPALALNLLKALSSRLRSSTMEAEELASLTVVERLTRQLQKLAEWSGMPVEGGVRIMVPLTQQELATLIGASRESVNRALVRLRSQGKVRLEKGWIVLRDEASPGTAPDVNSA